MLRVKELAQRLSLSRSQVYRLIASGELPHHKIRGAVRVSEEQLSDYLAGTKRERGKVSTTRRSPRPQLRFTR